MTTLSPRADVSMAGLRTKVVIGVMNKMHQPSLRAIAGHHGGGGENVSVATIKHLDETGFLCEMTVDDETKEVRIDFPEPLGKDNSAEAAFIGMAKVATKALSGAMAPGPDGVPLETEMLATRSAQLTKGVKMHTVTLSCAAVVADVGAEHEGRLGVQTLRQVEGKASSHLVFRPASVVLLNSLQPRIVAGSCRLVLHDDDRRFPPSFLRRIYRRLNAGGRTLEEWGADCDGRTQHISSIWRTAAEQPAAVSSDGPWDPALSFRRCRDILAIHSSRTLHAVSVMQQPQPQYVHQGDKDWALLLPAWSAEQTVACFEKQSIEKDKDEAAFAEVAREILKHCESADISDTAARL